jgi:hypothetical protein
MEQCVAWRQTCRHSTGMLHRDKYISVLQREEQRDRHMCLPGTSRFHLYLTMLTYGCVTRLDVLRAHVVSINGVSKSRSHKIETHSAEQWNDTACKHTCTPLRTMSGEGMKSAGMRPACVHRIEQCNIVGNNSWCDKAKQDSFENKWWVRCRCRRISTSRMTSERCG